MSAPSCLVVDRRRRRRRECVRASRHREFRPQQGRRDQRHGGEARVRESALVAVRERRRRRRRGDRMAVRDARRDGAAPLGLERGDVHAGHRRQRHGRRPTATSRTPAISARSRSPTARAWIATASGRRPAVGRGRRSARALAERRSELERRLGRRAARHDGPPRHQRRARADQRRRPARAGRRARRRARVPGRARHAGVAGRRTRSSAAWTRPSPVAADGSRARAPPKASIRRRPTIRGCAASRRTSCSTGASRRSRIASRRTRTSIRIQYGAPGIDRTIHLNETAHPAEHRAERRGPLDRPLGERRADRRHRRLQARRPVGRRVARCTAIELHVVERFSLDRSSGVLALRREYVAEDPLYFTGQFRGADAAFVGRLAVRAADLQRSELRDGPRHAAAQPSAAATRRAETPEPAPAKPWWMFWK